MDKKLRAHDTFMTTEIERLITRASFSIHELHQLRRYHLTVVRDLQHERLIHLLVTLFFGGLFLMAIGLLFGCALFFAQTPLLLMLAILLTFLLLIIELFYTRYYYTLKNGIQKLYVFTDRFYELEKVFKK